MLDTKKILEGGMTLDSLMLNEYMDCPRRFFFRHMLGWKPKGSSLKHLYFGIWIHSMLEMLLKDEELYNQTRVLAEELKIKTISDNILIDNLILSLENISPIKEFIELFNKDIPEDVELPDHKNLLRGLVSILYYCLTYDYPRIWNLPFEDGVRPAVEVVGKLLLEDVAITYRIDAVFKHNDQYWILEHKTGSPWGTWGENFTMAIQPAVYQMAIESFFDKKNIGGVVMDGILFKKTKTTKEDLKDPYRHFELIRFPVFFGKVKKELIVSKIMEIASLIKQQIEFLDKGVESLIINSTHHIFTGDFNRCWDYASRCPYIDYCHNILDPLNYHIEQGIPDEFDWEIWDPERKEENHG